MTDSIGWRFPPTNGGIGAGFNDSGIAHFSGAPLSSLARETIQNSLDARLSDEEPVHVSFELIHLKPEHIGVNELRAAIEACERETIIDAPVRAALAAARRSIDVKNIPCLRVSDRNTTGLQGDHWRALVKMQGVSYKPEYEGAGGSHGIGKYAPFSVSTPRTVFYWTCYEQRGKNVEQFQGKSVLMSHQGTEGETQGTGFYGVKKDCSELRSGKIPECFRVLTKERRPVNGTSLLILGFQAIEDWRRRIASSVIENFFHAISVGSLTVMIEPDESEDRPELLEIERTSLASWFEELGANVQRNEDAGDEDATSLEQARTFWEISNGPEPDAQKQDLDLGHCRLWIHVGEGLPGRVALVRSNGMMITTQQAGLLRFRGFRDFSALCVFEDPQGNELLRRMENPKHDQFEPDRLPEEDRARGRRALKRITDWIRGEIRGVAGPPKGGGRTELSELAAYLPDYYPEEPFEDDGPDGNEIREPGFGERVKVTLKPIRRPAPPVLSAQEDEASDDSDIDGEDTGEFGGSAAGANGGSGGSGGAGRGEGEGGRGGRGGDGRQRSISISGVRILSIPERENYYRLSFRAHAEGVVRLLLEEAGDSSVVPRTDIRAAADDESLETIRLAKDKRTVVEVTADEPIGGRAWRLSATAVDGGSS